MPGGVVESAPAIGSAHFLEFFSNGSGDYAMESRHGKEMKVSDGDPFARGLSIEDLAVINVKREFEMGIGVLQRANRIVHPRDHGHLFLKKGLKGPL